MGKQGQASLRRTPVAGQVRPIESGSRTATAASDSSPANYVGRVGSLAVALGVGAVMVWLPSVAAADTTGSPGSSASPSDSAADTASTSSADSATRRGQRPARPQQVDAAPDGVAVESAAPTAPNGSRAATSPSDAEAGSGSDRSPVARVGVERAQAGTSSREGRRPSAPLAAVTAEAPPAAGESASAAAPADAAPGAAPEISAAPQAAPASGSASTLGADVVSWLGAGSGDGPGSGALVWAAAAVARRETEGAPVAVRTPAAGQAGQNPIADFIRIFIGNGTAENPNGGLLLGNGYSWNAPSWTGRAGRHGRQARADRGGGGVF